MVGGQEDRGCQKGETRAAEAAKIQDREAPCLKDVLCLQVAGGSGDLALVVIPVTGVPRDD